MDEGLGFALIPVFLTVIPITISLVVLYAILRDIKLSIFGSIIGFIGAFVVGYVIPIWEGFSIIWHLARSLLLNIVMLFWNHDNSFIKTRSLSHKLTAFTAHILIMTEWDYQVFHPSCMMP